ncbi:heterodisulfide reductase subunit C [Desulfotomaculum arcticum]|uniref:Heterodisulfide reductase subunit C n=1 Tax=Desulfotruncus arcticus DSM 17038 TaxID=1121424 RepID=A0A1I2PRW2_9FIRM|nr:4Fe-4S dicluster domain-containing protein [Desulfotruncus arcticus]SFG16141.1 heterodisulfide reductase subunit C [Desulfotomaculum arcticum] [Desulfotruncus arcticus DSM 17038]
MSVAFNLTNSLKDNMDFINIVGKESGQPVEQCYQCGKCTAGCPVAFAMDYPPHRVLRMVQLGLKENVLKSQAIWLCAGCSTCTSRCPRNVDLAQVMDSLRGLAKHEGVPLDDRARDVSLFYDCFLNTVKNNGKLHELGMMLNYNLKNKHLFKNANTGLAMFTRSKIKFLPAKTKNHRDVAKIFQRVHELEGEAR